MRNDVITAGGRGLLRANSYLHDSTTGPCGLSTCRWHASLGRLGGMDSVRVKRVRLKRLMILTYEQGQGGFNEAWGRSYCVVTQELKITTSLLAFRKDWGLSLEVLRTE